MIVGNFPDIKKRMQRRGLPPETHAHADKFLYKLHKHSIINLSWCRINGCAWVLTHLSAGLLCCNTVACHDTFLWWGNPADGSKALVGSHVKRFLKIFI